MKLSTLFPSKWLKHADLAGQSHAVVIDRFETEIFDDGEKGVLYFRDRRKGLVLNKTNAYAIDEAYGEDDTTAWVGRPIMLVPARVEFKGRMVDSIRVQIIPGQPAHAHAPAPASTPAPVAAGRRVELDDEIPFCLEDR